MADDAIGGFFAINGGGIDEVGAGKVAYLAPDTLRWEDTHRSYSDFLVWSWSGRLDEYYRSHRWEGWREECRALPGDRSFFFYPFLWAKGPPVTERYRATVPVGEAFGMILDFRRQLSHSSR